MVWHKGFRCGYCGLRVRLTGDPRHPGYGVVDGVGGPVGGPVPARGELPDLAVLHRFCNRVRFRAGASPRGVLLRRAWLGWATERFEACGPQRHYGLRHHERLGLHASTLRTPRLYAKHWQIRKMRCAARAARSYAPEPDADPR